MGDLTTAPLPPDKNGRPSSITMAVALPTPTELTRWELADFLAFAQVGPLPLGQLEGQDANRSIRVADHNASARDLPRPPHDFADSALARNDVFRIERCGPQRRAGERGEARGNRCQSTGGNCLTRLGTLSFGIGTRGFMARRVSSSKCDTAQSRNGLSSAGTMYQGATGVEHRVKSMLKASWYSSQ
jgi:hypothetical protein